jgi:beta-glucoside kinase
LHHIPVFIENDGNLGGLSEARLLREKYNKVLYITIGTGIGDAIIINGMIDPNLSDGEGGQMVIEHGGQLKRWEELASGHALVQKYGKLASQIDDPKIWRDFAKKLALGLDPLLAAFQPEVVIIGGGVGAHFAKFGDKLDMELIKLSNKMVKVPPIVQAKRPEEAVIYGCYEYIRQQS